MERLSAGLALTCGALAAGIGAAGIGAAGTGPTGMGTALGFTPLFSRVERSEQSRGFGGRQRLLRGLPKLGPLCLPPLLRK